MAALKKNVSGQNFTFMLVNSSTGAPLTGASPTVYVTKDNGAQATGAGTVTETGHGQYNYAPTQGETNGVDIGFCVNVSGGVPVNIDFHTDQCDTNGFLQVDVEAINAFTLAAQALAQSTQSIAWGTASGGSSTTVNVSALTNPSSINDPGQLNGRTILFLGTTGTAGLKAQASQIQGTTTGATPTLTVVAMTRAPANGELFVIL